LSIVRDSNFEFACINAYIFKQVINLRNETGIYIYFIMIVIVFAFFYFINKDEQANLNNLTF